MSLLSDAVQRNEDGERWDIVCPITDGTCGQRDPETKVVTPFTSREWPTKAVARARLDEHIAEHRGEAPMSSLEDFRRKHKLDVAYNPDGSTVVTVKDLS
jgi:hypothetical protein